VQVNTSTSCTWRATSNARWIEVTSGSVGVGDGRVRYRIEENNGRADRTGTITIAGRTFTVHQRGENGDDLTEN
jgi:hypothetical protein